MALERHVAGCAACREELRRARVLEGALAALPMLAELPSGLEAATLQRVRHEAAREAGPPAASGWRDWVTFAVPAFAAAAVLVVAVGILRDRSPAPDGAHPAESTAAVATRTAAPARVEPAERKPRAAEVQTARAPERPKEAPPEPAGGGAAGEPPALAAASRSQALELPPDLAARPDLFVDLPILKHLEKLQNFDAIRTVDGPGEAPSNG